MIIVNEKDRALAAWLLETVGAEAIQMAESQLSGSRNPYVSNICKILGLEPPPDLLERIEQAETAAARMAFRARFRKNN